MMLCRFGLCLDNFSSVMQGCACITEIEKLKEIIGKSFTSDIIYLQIVLLETAKMQNY